MNADLLRPIVLQCEFDAPQGHVSIDSESSHTNLWARLGRVNEHGQFDLIRESTQAVLPDPYLVSH
jgi:branched-chain amino acid transport system substrate-binding protein